MGMRSPGGLAVNPLTRVPVNAARCRTCLAPCKAYPNVGRGVAVCYIAVGSGEVDVQPHQGTAVGRQSSSAHTHTAEEFAVVSQQCCGYI